MGHLRQFQMVSAIAAALGSLVGAPVVFNATPAARAGDIVSIQGANFGLTPTVYLDTPSGTSPLTLINQVGDWVAVQIPATATGSFSVRVQNGTGTGAPAKLNMARVDHLDAMQVVPGGKARMIGRNLLLPGYTPAVLFDGLAATVDTSNSNEHVLFITVPMGLAATSASVITADNGNGSGAYTVTRTISVVTGATGDPFALGVGWGAAFTALSARVIDPTTDSRLSIKCSTGATDNTAGLTAAGQLAQSLGGAVVKLPAGTFNVANGFQLGSNIVLQGSGKGVTFIRYLNVTPLYGGSMDVAGLADLTMQCAGTGGGSILLHDSTRLFIKNVIFALGTAQQTFLSNNKNLAVIGCDFIQANTQNQTSAQGPFTFGGSRGYVFTGNTITQQVGTSAFAQSTDGYIANNHWSRDAGYVRSDPNAKVLHVMAIDFAARIAIIGNTFDVINGTIDPTANDGETILTEGGGNVRTENLGTVQSATTTTIVDATNTFLTDPLGTGSIPENYGVAIVAGKGMGQNRRIASIVGGTITVGTPWALTPDATSKYATMVWGLEKSLIKGNTLTGNPRGIQLYQTGTREVDIISNRLIDNGTIMLRAYQSVGDKQFMPMYNIRIANNVVNNSTAHTTPAAIGAVLTNHDGGNFGTAIIGLDVSGNALTAARPNIIGDSRFDYVNTDGFTLRMQVETSSYSPSTVPRILGALLRGNSCKSCDVAFRIGTGASGTVIADNTLSDTPTLFTNVASAGGELAASTVTYISPVVGDGDLTVYAMWSNPATWGGTIPATGENRSIDGPVMYDLATPLTLGDLTIGVNGVLKPHPTMTTSLTVKSMTVLGTFTAGTSVIPFGTAGNTHTLSFTGNRRTTQVDPITGLDTSIPIVIGLTHVGDMSTGNDGRWNDNYGLNRGLIVMPGGQLLIKAAMPAVSRTYLAAHALKGDRSITLADSVYWKQGQQIILPPTGFQCATRQTEEFTIAADTNGSNVVQLTSAIGYDRWGLMMYPTDAGMSLSPTKLIKPGMTPTQIAAAPSTAFTLYDPVTNPTGMKADIRTKTQVDQRCPVEVSTRQINFRGVNDTAWQNDKFGVHLMFMGLESVVNIDGLGIQYAGQEGAQGRYPIHWHILSYRPSDGALLGDIPAGNGSVTRTFIRDSAQRMAVIHATCGAVFQGNTGLNINGHGFLLEDATERRNLIDANRIYGNRNASQTRALKASEILATGGHVSAFWISNFDNTFTNNWTCDFDGVGIWNIPGFTHTNTSDPVIKGTGRAKFTCAGNINIFGQTRTITLTCTNAAVPALFSRSDSLGQTLADVSATSDLSSGITNLLTGADGGVPLLMGTVTTPFAVGDQITFNITRLGGTFGPSKLAGSFPNSDPFILPTLLYKDNKVWGGENGAFTQQPIYNEAHSLGGTQKIGNYDPNINFSFQQFEGTEIHHCMDAYHNQVASPQYPSWVVSDNRRSDIAGATTPAGSARTFGLLTIHKSFNRDDEVAPYVYRNSGLNNFQHASLSTYHGTLLHINATAYDYADGVPAGVDIGTYSLQSVSVFEGWDFYTDPLDNSFQKNTGTRLWNSLLMFRSPPLWRTLPFYSDVTPAGFQNGNGNILGGACGIRDKDGTLAGTTAATNSWNLTSHPFATTGSGNILSSNASHSSYTFARMVGIIPKNSDFGSPGFTTAVFGGRTYTRNGGAAAARADGVGRDDAQAGTEVQGHRFTRCDPTTLQPLSYTDASGTHRLDYDSPGPAFINQRTFAHAACPVGSAVRVSIIGATSPRLYASGRTSQMGRTIMAGDATTDQLLLGQDWAGPATPSYIGIGRAQAFGYPSMMQGGNQSKTLTVANSLSDLVDNSKTPIIYGGYYCYDPSTNTMWMKIFPPTSVWGGNNGDNNQLNLDWVITA